jgi:hypothetical protein
MNWISSFITQLYNVRWVFCLILDSHYIKDSKE